MTGPAIKNYYSTILSQQQEKIISYTGDNNLLHQEITILSQQQETILSYTGDNNLLHQEITRVSDEQIQQDLGVSSTGALGLRKVINNITK